jgi:hypothetical protein
MTDGVELPFKMFFLSKLFKFSNAQQWVRSASWNCWLRMRACPLMTRSHDVRLDCRQICCDFSFATCCKFEKTLWNFTKPTTMHKTLLNYQWMFMSFVRQHSLDLLCPNITPHTAPKCSKNLQTADNIEGTRQNGQTNVFPFGSF